MRMLHIVAFTLLAIGGLNWGLVGLLNLNLVELILGSLPAVERTVYVLVGVSAVYVFATHMKDCRTCTPDHKHEETAAKE